MVRGSASAASAVRTLLERRDDSIKKALPSDPDSEASYPNRESRESFGFWVDVEPEPLPHPFLVSTSPDMLATLGLDASAAADAEFVSFFAGGSPPGGGRAWATPYAVSVFGQSIDAPDPFGRGNGYGDGRAATLGEFSLASGERWELQLKGSGTTPFSRGGDGRAVLRSSVREYLVSEAMHHMGVPTTRALSLVASATLFTRRAWYADDDTRRAHPPDTLVEERCAITCRAAPSFLRVGHVELHSRRAMRKEEGAAEKLAEFVRYAIGREFPEIDGTAPLATQAIEMLRAFARRQAETVTAWVRVGYVQGNMNSDNCLLSGRTMDYGPFGFVEEYSELWTPFTSDMEAKFGFERQPLAAQVNVMTLGRALIPLFDGDGREEAIDALQSIVQEEYPAVLKASMDEMRRAKLGIAVWDDGADALWKALRPLMAKSAVDFVIFFRQLAAITNADAAAAAAAGLSDDAAAADVLLERVSPSFYSEESAREAQGEWREWFAAYARRLAADGRPDGERSAEIRRTSPKYTPREWMLAEAYRAAEKSDFGPLEELAALFRAPFDEHPELEAKYYRRAPHGQAKVGGLSYFS